MWVEPAGRQSGGDGGGGWARSDRGLVQLVAYPVRCREVWVEERVRTYEGKVFGACVCVCVW